MIYQTWIPSTALIAIALISIGMIMHGLMEIVKEHWPNI